MGDKADDKKQPSEELLGILAVNVKMLRKARGFTQESLGAKCEFHPTFVSMVERSQRNVTISTLEIFATALGVQPFELLQEGYTEER